MNDQEKIAKVMAWAEDRELFFRECLMIRPKKGGLKHFIPRPLQLDTNHIIRTQRRVKITKARQLGITTGALADRFHEALFSPFTRAAVAAHHKDTAEEILQIISTFYECLPPWFKAIKLFSTKKDNADTFHLRNGSVIKVGTANTEFWRGQTFQHAHLTEAAYYSDLLGVQVSLSQAIGDTGTIAYETSANGHNQWFDFWGDQNNGFVPLFHSWLLDPEYVADPATLPRVLTTIELDYIEENQLPPERAAWFVKNLREKCGSNIQKFNQEMPISIDVAFIATGARYFQVVYNVTQEYEDGLQAYEPPIPGHTYYIGADPAAGAPTGDKSAAVVLDTTKVPYIIVATLNSRVSIPAFAEEIQILSSQYNRAMVNPETNNHGHALILELRRKNVPLFTGSRFNGKQVYLANEAGTTITATSRHVLLSALLKATAQGTLTVKCPRVQAQMDTFIYGKMNKPQADTGKFDDLVFATAHALYAGRTPSTETAEERAPVGTIEILQYELRTGRLYEGDRGGNPLDDW